MPTPAGPSDLVAARPVFHASHPSSPFSFLVARIHSTPLEKHTSGAQPATQTSVPAPPASDVPERVRCGSDGSPAAAARLPPRSCQRRRRAGVPTSGAAGPAPVHLGRGGGVRRRRERGHRGAQWLGRRVRGQGARVRRDQRRRLRYRQVHRHRDHRREDHLRFQVPGSARRGRVADGLPPLLPQRLCVHQRGVQRLLEQLRQGRPHGPDGAQSGRSHRCVSCRHRDADIRDGPLRAVHQQRPHRRALRVRPRPAGIIPLRDVRSQGAAEVDEDHVAGRAEDEGGARDRDDPAGEDVRAEQDGEDRHGARPAQLLRLHLPLLRLALHPPQPPQARARRPRILICHAKLVVASV